MPKNIDAKLKTVQNLFSNGTEAVLGEDGIYIIPDYQRAYNWKANEQCDKLWQDIENFIDDPNANNYFFGSIIIDNEQDKLNLIDGQQRVTTFMLLLKALLVKINAVLDNFSNDEDAKRLKVGLEKRRSDIICCLYSIDVDDVYMLVEGSKKYSDYAIKYCNKSINEQYKDELSKILYGKDLEEIRGKVKEIKYKQGNNRFTNFYKNFLFFTEKLKDMGIDRLNNFAKKLLANCQVIVVVSYQTDESIEIFNSLNSTGMPLGDADIISARLYEKFNSSKADFSTAWGEIIRVTNDLGAKKIVTIDEIFNQYMYVIRAQRGERDTTLPSVRRYFTEINTAPISDSNKFVEDLKYLTGIWSDGESDTQNDDGETLKNIQNVRQILLKNNNNFKFYYAAYHYLNKNDTYAEKLKFAEELLKLFAILSIKEIGYSSKLFKQFLINLNMQMGQGASNGEIVGAIHDHILKNFDRENIKEKLLTSYAEKGIVYLNEYLYAKEKGVTLNLSSSDIEIEHIMPASGKNIIAIRADAGMDEQEFSYYADKLGNKILLEQNINGSVSNDWFRVKKQTSVTEKRGYRDSRFPIALSLVNYPKDKWEKDDIDAATEKAAERVVKFIFG